MSTIKVLKITVQRESFEELLAVTVYGYFLLFSTCHLLPTTYYLLLTIRLVKGIIRQISR